MMAESKPKKEWICKCGHPATMHFWKSKESVEDTYEKKAYVEGTEGLYFMGECWYGLVSKNKKCYCTWLEFETRDELVQFVTEFQEQQKAANSNATTLD
jgi:hypothetical protein